MKIDLKPAEWDFRTIPKDAIELEAAVAYEYSRDHSKTVEVFQDWLESELVMPVQFWWVEDDDKGYPAEEKNVPQGLSVRDAILRSFELELDPEIREEEGPEEYDLWSCCPEAIFKHPLSDFVGTLIGWPTPFQASRNEDWFSWVIDSMRESRNQAKIFRKPVVAVEEGEQKRPFKRRPDQKPIPQFAFEIDLGCTKGAIQKGFKDWLDSVHVDKRSGKSEIDRARGDLKALSALRLERRGFCGKGAKYPKIRAALDLYAPDDGLLVDKGKGTKVILPIYTNQGGFDDAAARAISRRRDFEI
jgi:hypothetical protein